MTAMRIEQKWGFGMAPVKAKIESERMACIQHVRRHICDEEAVSATSLTESLPVVKGLFSRCWRQDQWDWFTVWRQLGRPGMQRSRDLAEDLGGLRRSILRESPESESAHSRRLRENGLCVFLRAFETGDQPLSEGYGYVYILSTREHKEILKVGFTTRDVSQRVKEINSSTGVVVPYGVRALWVVKSADVVESEIHLLLDEYRIRDDREFFEVDFRLAFKIIQEHIRNRRAEL